MKDRYIHIINAGMYVPIFFQPWWLDIVCGPEKWDAVVIEKNGVVEGVLPYHQKKQANFTKIGMPVLTPFLGYWLYYPKDINYSNKISFENRVVKELLHQLPNVSRIDQILSPQHTNWLPLKWNGFEQNSLVTYQLTGLRKMKNPIDYYHFKTRNIIRKHEKEIQISTCSDAGHLFDSLKSTIEEKKGSLIASQEIFQQLYESSHQRGMGELYLAKNKNGQVLASGFVVWDQQTAYYLFRARNKKVESSGALSVMTNHIIEQLVGKVDAFDFLGSNLEEVEKFVRKFGTRQYPMHFVWKTNSKLYEALKKVRG